MLSCQRELFDIPRAVCYLNAAAYSPLPKLVQEAAHVAIWRKAQPWRVDAQFAEEMNERTRRAAARLIKADVNDVAIVSSVGYGVATAGKVLAVPPDSRVLVLRDDHTSPVLEWMSRSATEDFVVEVVARQGRQSWTEALLAAMERPGARPLALVSISNVHWADGGIVDLDVVMPKVRRLGGAILIDATHAVGMMDFDVGRLDPDFVCFPTYKWLLGPYGRAFLYVAKRHQAGIPLEQTAPARKHVRAEADIYFDDTSYVDNARRYDMGERDHFISLDMAAVAMEMVHAWGPAALGAYAASMTRQLAEALAEIPGLEILPETVRAPHLLSVGFTSGMPTDLVKRLEASQVYAAPRLGRLRISPHVYNDAADVTRFLDVFQEEVARNRA